MEQVDLDRINVLTGHIPDDVKSILDVGCGGGIFLNHLMSYSDRFDRLCGVDRSRSALRYVETQKSLASINQLPFGNNVFDMVSSLEVIEHLPTDIYNLALEELHRTSKKYILICVPYNQDLSKSLVKCNVCFTRYNPDYHVRSFDNLSIINLFNNYKAKCLETFYIHRAPYYIGRSYLLLFVRSFLGKRIPWYAICPLCGYKNDLEGISGSTANRNQLLLDDILKKIFTFWPHKLSYKWIAGLYLKE